MIYFCCEQLRREKVRGSALNGIDFLEVLDHEAPTLAERQRTLFVHFVNPLASVLPPANLSIEGGERTRDVKVTSTAIAASDQHVLEAKVNHPGDFSLYTLRLVQDPFHTQPPAGFDPPLSVVEFSFKVECRTDFDCRTERICPPELQPQPEINYLAKDYASFRRLLLDRMVLLMPQWRERNPADFGVTLVELLAYIGDQFSYQQDAIATEAYLGTARRRVSVRRHALLVDYFMHEGSNARTWVQVQVNGANVPLTKGTVLLTQVPGLDKRILPPGDLPTYLHTLPLRPEVFETMQEMTLYQAHNQLSFYAWADKECCLPRGATRATLSGHFPHLREGNVLIFAEACGPQTGKPEDADPARRHAVRLTEVIAARFELTDESLTNLLADGVPNDLVVKLGGIKNQKFFGAENFLAAVRERIGEAETVQFKSQILNRAQQESLTDPLTGEAITETAWADEDALLFPFCLSSQTDAEHGRQYIENVSIALGNIVLADHGLAINHEFLGKVPQPRLLRPPASSGDRCQERQPEPIPPRFQPHLQEQPLTHAALYDSTASASAALRWSMREVLPAIALESVHNSDTASWKPKRELLNSDPDDTDFVVEIESDGTTFLRFGDDQRGMRPEPETAFTATYRVGNGVAGNVGAEAIAHIVSGDSAIVVVRNPLPARGGIEPESIEDVRQRAPSAFRTQERAVTPEDYAEVSERHAQVQQAAATFRWTGSWHTVFVTVDRQGGRTVDDPFETEMRRHVERYRMAGHDLEIDGPRFVSLEIEMHICVKPHYFRSDVKAALLRIFSNQILPDGQRGVFHPDNFTFGQPVYLSRLYAAAQAVPGVDSVLMTTFQRQGTPEQKALDEGKLTLGRLEIARLDNDPNFPEHGVFRLQLGGGK